MYYRTAASERRGKNLKDLRTCTCNSRPELGPDCLMCATFARQWTHAKRAASCVSHIHRVKPRSVRSEQTPNFLLTPPSRWSDPPAAICLSRFTKRRLVKSFWNAQGHFGKRFAWRANVTAMRTSVRRVYRVTSLIRNNPLLGPCSRTIPRVLWWSEGGGLFLMIEVPL